MKIIDSLKGKILKKSKPREVRGDIVESIEKKKETEYYDVEPMWAIPSNYYLIWSGRQDGKTYGWLLKLLEEVVFKKNKTIVYVRRKQLQATGRRTEELFKQIVRDGHISRLSNNKWNGVHYFGGKFTLTIADGNGKITKDESFFCKTYGLDQDIEDAKGEGYGEVGAILFDEFMSFEEGYLWNELSKFNNMISTVTRGRIVPIIMLGNTVDPDCPYFNQFGLWRANCQEQGTIDVYEVGPENNKTIFACDYPLPSINSKRNAILYAYDDGSQTSTMINYGGWDYGEFPLLPIKFLHKEIRRVFYIVYYDKIVQCEVVVHEGIRFLYCHQKTTPIRNWDRDLIFTIDMDPRRNVRQNMMKPIDDLGKYVYSFFQNDNVYYQDASVGRTVKNYFDYYKNKR